MNNIIVRRGLIECVVSAASLGFLTVYSFLRSIALNIRGYRVSPGVSLFVSSVFFQSKKNAIFIGKNTRVGRNTRISAGFDGRIEVGANVLIDEGTCVMAQEHVYIGDNTMIAPYCFITDFNHQFDRTDIPIAKQGYKTKKVRIEEDVWIGTHCIILPGVTLGKGSVVGAGSVVTKSVKSYSVVAGNPAKVIKQRK